MPGRMSIHGERKYRISTNEYGRVLLAKKKRSLQNANCAGFFYSTWRSQVQKRS